MSRSGDRSSGLVGRTGRMGGSAEKPTWGLTHQGWNPSGWGSDDLTPTPFLPQGVSAGYYPKQPGGRGRLPLH